MYAAPEGGVYCAHAPVAPNSSANSSVYFANTYPIIGEVSGSYLANTLITNVIVADVDPHVYVTCPADTTYSVSETFWYTSTSNGLSATIFTDTISPIQLFYDNALGETNPPTLLSRSNEVQLYSPAYSSDPSNCSVISINSISTNPFESAVLDGNLNDVYYTRFYINNDYTAENTQWGNAVSKAVSQTLNLATGDYAEDIVCYLNGYRPLSSNFKVFAKIHKNTDTESFGAKDWTLLNCTYNNNVYSSSTNANDYVQYTYSFNNFPNSAFTYASSVSTTLNSANITAATGVFSANIAVGNLVKVYSPLFANTNYWIGSVTNVVNSTVITIDQPVSNNSMVGAGLSLDLIAYPLQAFKPIYNQNVVRYYTKSGNYFDTYDTFAVKIVFLSNNLSIIPGVSSIQAIAVSA